MRKGFGLSCQLRAAACFIALVGAVGGRLCAQEKKAPLSDADLVDSVRNSVVYLLADARGPDKGSAASGSGFFIAPGGQIVTNYHVIAGMCEVMASGGSGTKITVSREGGQDFGEPQILAWDQKRDLAVLQIAGNRAPRLPLGDSDRVRLGEDVISLGYPMSLFLGFNLTFTKGNVSSIRQDDKGQQEIQHTASIAPGSSGGPLLDQSGKVIGVNYATLGTGSKQEGAIPAGPPGNMNFAIPVNDLRNLLSQAKPPMSLTTFCQQGGPPPGPPGEKHALTQIFQSEPACLFPGQRTSFHGELQEGRYYVFAVKRLQGSGKIEFGVYSSQEDFRGTDREEAEGVLMLPYKPDHSGKYNMIIGVTEGHARTCFLIALFAVESH